MSHTSEDFEMSDVLGEGSYSTVFLARDKNTGKEYAMKVLDKRHIIKERKVKYVTVEKDVLNMCDHPFIVQLHFTFQDQNNLYFCLELCPGDLLKRIKEAPFTTEAVRFYSAEIIEAVHYLHTKDVLHRDLKPENILLKNDHIKLTDYGTAKITNKEEEETTKSFVGTAEYVSPEVLSEKEASPMSDFWAIGCIMIQMISQKPPFKGANDYQTFQKVSKLQYNLPLDFPDKVRQVTSRLIVLEPPNRADYKELKHMEFYKGLYFDKLHLEIPPPFHPVLASEEELPTQGRKTRMSFSSFSKPKPAVLESDPTKLLTTIDQKNLLVSAFLKENEMIIKMGILHKKKGLVPRKRWFVLTDGPRFMYFKGDAMQLKGESLTIQEKGASDSEDSGNEEKTINNLTLKGCIPWSDDVEAEVKNKTIFYVNTPKRTYHLIDQSGHAETWVESIKTVKMLANPNTLHL